MNTTTTTKERNDMETESLSPWISVKDRLPRKENGRETGNVMVRGHNPDIGRDYTQIRSWRHVGPGSWYSHWMPIPALPSLPVDPAQEAFDAWYVPAHSKHRKEQQEAFIAGFRAKDGGQA